MRRNKHRVTILVFSFLLALLPAYTYAQSCEAPSSCSTNYRVDQTFFGSGGETNATSPSYQARQTLGELGAGNTASANYQAYAGFNTNDEPFLEFVVTGNSIDLGYLDTASASTATGTFYVRAWLTSGYVVRTQSNPPTNSQNGHQLTPLSTPAASSPGTEQFGINLRDNTSPDIGAEPEQVPDSSFSFGQVASGYDTIDSFKYANGDVIARATQSTSVTIYTVSYLFNISNSTPSGHYTFDHVLIATATY